MEVTLDKRYPIAAGPAQAWTVLRDVRAVAGCMPGAAITEQLDGTHYKGHVKVKVGPATAAFAGDIEVLSLDESTQRLNLLGKGADRSGSTAAMDLVATVEPGDTPGTSVLVGQAKVTVNGKFAQFGGRMMVQVSDMILQQFADNFSATAAAQPVPQAEVTAAQPVPQADVTAAQPVPQAEVAAAQPVPQAEAAAAQPVPQAEAAAAQPAAAAVMEEVPAPVVHAAAPAATVNAATGGAAGAVPAPPAPRPVAPVVVTAAAKELNALAIVWMLVKNWFAGLFGKRA
ncbi:SRPBCC family protein [Aquabacterium sp. OR-4]|uniref:SRPBCC family protein n=1 Tax=Aquabacterium sp. OR-4 TaxID=2978127 RepID=UPI0021B40414|nr:SRPBCC family protein [Aquabacterium sp. OR-4]MDT7835730.1 SRPBCC family protein [Aquabacterium sp. OR-4]